MSQADQALAFFLRALGALDLLALGAVVMPRRWMEVAHYWAGLGVMPEGPVVGYLARSASVLYALHGAMILFVSFDVRRYGPLITLLGFAALAHGAILLGVDLAEGMPLWWTFGEGMGYFGIGTCVLILRREATRTQPPFTFRET